MLFARILERIPERKILVNATASWAGAVAQLVTAFYMAPVLVRGLGDQRYGVWALVESILAYLTLFDLGVGAAVVRYVARFEGINDVKSVNRVLSTSFALFAGAGLAAFSVALLILVPLWSWIPVPPDLRSEAWWLLALLAANIAIGLPMGVFPAVLDGLQRYPAKTFARTSLLIVRCLLSIVLVNSGHKLVALALLFTGMSIIENCVMALSAWRYLPGLRLSFREVNAATFRMIRGYSANALVAMIAGRISFQTDAFVIGVFLPVQHITFFAIGARLVEYTKNLMRSLTMVLTPMFSQLDSRNDVESMRRLWLETSRWLLWIILPVQLGIWSLGKPFLTLWIGPAYANASYPVLAILALPLVLVTTQSVSGRVLYGADRLRWFSRMSLLESISNLALSIALVRSFGIEGVAWGTTIPSFAFNAALAVHTARTLKCSFVRYVLDIFSLPLLVGLVPLLVWISLQRIVEIHSWASLLSVGLAGIVPYLISVFGLEFRAAWLRVPRLRENSPSDPKELAGKSS